MKTRKLLVFLLCFVLLVASLAVIASAKGATPTTSVKETTNSNGTIKTKYGDIPKEYASADTYPFVVFKYKNDVLQTGTKGYKTMKEALDGAKAYQQSNWDSTNKVNLGNVYSSKIILRKNYTTTTADKYDNYAQIMGETVLDLNGFTLTQGKAKDLNGIFYQVTSKPWGLPEAGNRGVYETEITVINGNLAVNDKSVFYGNVWTCFYVDESGKTVTTIYDANGTKINNASLCKDDAGNYYYVDVNGNRIEKVYHEDKKEIKGLTHSIASIADKQFTWNFNNVNFQFVSGATSTNMLINYTGPQGVKMTPPTAAAPFNFNYTNCTFDLTYAPAGTVTLFNAAPSESNWIKTTVTVTGCEIKATSGSRFSAFKLFNVENKRGSSVTFLPDENGDVLELNITDGSKPTVPSSYVTIDGKNLYWHNVDGKYVLTECAADSHACSCGTIYTDCVDENTDNVCDLCGAAKVGGTWISTNDPFVVLDADGNYSSTKKNFKAAFDAAAKIDGSTIVLLCDYTNWTADKSNNLKALNGEVTIDLNGKTLTRDFDGAYIFDNWLDGATTADAAKVTFKNGTLNAERWLVCLSGNDAIANEKQIDLSFENVTFKVASNYNSNDGFGIVVHNQTYNKTITANLTFTDCTLDLTDKAPSFTVTNAPLLNLAVNNQSGVDYVKATVTIDGMTILANNFATKSLLKVHADDVVKVSDLTLVMPEGKAPVTPATADYFVVEGKNVYFHKSGDVYTLSECLDPATNHDCTCGLVYSTDCTDSDKDHTCDICGETSECLDENKDHICDLCDKTYTCQTADFNKDHVCEFCGEEYSKCTDADKNEICDWCGYVMNTYEIKNIDPKYADVNEYPFFLLKYENGVYTFVEACKSFYGNQGKANGTVQTPAAMDDAIYDVLPNANKYDIENGVYVPEKSGGSVVEAVIVARRDYDLKMGNDGTANIERHDNMAHMQGTVTVDLNGHTLREAEGSNKAIFTITAKGWPDAADKVYTFPSTLNIINGRIEVRKYAATSVGTTDAIQDKKPEFTVDNSVYNVNYSNVTFGLASGATTATFAYATGNSTNKYPAVAKVNVSFTDCVFDLQTNAITSAITIINGDTTGKDVDTDITVNRCKILASDMTAVTFNKSSTTNGSSTLISKDLTLVMPEGAIAPALTNTVTIDNGVVCSFVKSATAEGNVTYVLYPSVMVDYKIKTSVTLYSNFVYNIYVPAANVQAITVNGKTAEYTATNIDGKDYYLVKVNLPAGETLGDIALKVTLTSGATTVDANWTLSVLNYTKSVLAGDYNTTTKTLMKDMLVYASAAHTYFENTEAVAAKLDAIKTLLGDYEAALPTGEAKTPAENPYFSEVAVSLGAVPSFKFTLATGYTADNFTFTVGGKEATVIAGDGYLEVVMYAYMMLEDVTYVVNGTDATGTYNLYSYYGFVNGLEGENRDEDLIALTAALMKYSVSAKKYRDYIVYETCQHDYADGLCTKCGEEDPDKGSLTLTAPASIYTNYAGKDITANFTKAWYKGEVTYTTNHPNVFVENGKIFAKGDFASAVDVIVTATTEHHTATVTVTVSKFNNHSSETKVQWYENNIIKEENKGGMIFVGDSYFDGYNAAPYGTSVPSFWRDFYQDYAGEKAFLMGISSSQILELETVSERIVYPMEPTAIVMHIGHNDMHSGTISPEDFVARLQALVNEYHKNLPNAKIYILSVDPKKTAATDTANPDYEKRYNNSFVKVPAVNAAVKALAENTDWITYVDTTSIFYTKNAAGEITVVNTNMYPSSDGSHPTLVAYDLIKIKIEEASGKTLDNVININNANASYDIGTAGKTYEIDGDFVLSGRLVITQFQKNNAHLQFSFGGVNGNRPYRFILWDSSKDGKFGLGCEENGTYTDETATGVMLYDAANGLVLNWTLVVKESKAYFFIGGKLQRTFENPAFSGTLNIDATLIDAILYDIDLIEKNANATEYNNYVAPYFAEDVANVEMFGQGGDITGMGKTFTDASGNALTNNYIVKGKLNIAAFGKSNPHIQFRVGSNYRFLLWDSNRDGKFGAGYTEGSSNVNDTGAVTLYDANFGLVVDWAVVVDEGKAYWFINGKLEKVFESPKLENFNLGALHTDAYFYDIEIFVKSENSDAYTKEYNEYFSYSFEINNYDGTAGTGTVSSTGPTYTKDTYGNALSGSNYVISGTLEITKMKMKDNMHLQFYFCNNWRFLLWDQAGNGKFGAGYQENGTHVNDLAVGEKYDGTSGTLTLDWAVIVKDGKAYWYINGELVKTFTEPSANAFGSINIGATKMEVSVYDVVIYAENGSAANYNATVSKYLK